MSSEILKMNHIECKMAGPFNRVEFLTKNQTCRYLPATAPLGRYPRVFLPSVQRPAPAQLWLTDLVTAWSQEQAPHPRVDKEMEWHLIQCSK